MYPSEDFLVEKRFGLNLLLIVNDSVEDYIESTLIRLKGAFWQSRVLKRNLRCYPEWAFNGCLSHIAVVLMDADDGHAIERWVFDITVKDATTRYVSLRDWHHRYSP